MVWVEDRQKLARRRSATYSLAAAYNLVDALRDKCSELLGQTRIEIAGHPTGDRIVDDVARSMEALDRATGLLLEARNAARNADVMVWVPDADDQ